VDVMERIEASKQRLSELESMMDEADKEVKNALKLLNEAKRVRDFYNELYLGELNLMRKFLED
jgi:hypothetical protein